MFNSETFTTLEPLKFREDKYTFLFDSPKTINDLLFYKIPIFICAFSIQWFPFTGLRDSLLDAQYHICVSRNPLVGVLDGGQSLHFYF